MDLTWHDRRKQMRKMTTEIAEIGGQRRKRWSRFSSYCTQTEPCYSVFFFFLTMQCLFQHIMHVTINTYPSLRSEYDNGSCIHRKNSFQWLFFVSKNSFLLIITLNLILITKMEKQVYLTNHFVLSKFVRINANKLTNLSLSIGLKSDFHSNKYSLIIVNNSKKKK